jgi:hypothetical protein
MRHYWTREEEDFILQLIGYYPVKKIVTRVKANYSLPISDLAIKAKIEKLARVNKERVRDRVDNYSMLSVARFLGVRDIIVRRYISSGLKAHKCGGLWVIKHKDLVQFAKENPRRFRSCSVDGLEWLFEGDKDWVDLVINSKPLKPLRPILCVNTGKVYPSLRSLGIEMGISRDRIKTYLESGLPTQVNGEYLTFRWAD